MKRKCLESEGRVLQRKKKKAGVCPKGSLLTSLVVFFFFDSSRGESTCQAAVGEVSFLRGAVSALHRSIGFHEAFSHCVAHYEN